MSEPFELEPSDPIGMPSPAVIQELRNLYKAASEASSDYTEAVKVQAEKHSITVGALKRYVSALEKDTTDDALREARDLETLIGEKRHDGP